MALATRSYRIRAYPNGAQRRLLDRWFGTTRWLWNTTLAIRSEGYRTCGLKLTGTDLSGWVTQWKRTAGHEWLADAPATVLTHCLRDQDRAFRNFFAGRARYPRFKRKALRGSMCFQGLGVDWIRGLLRVPKLGVLKLAEALPDIERPDSVTLLRDSAGCYYVSFRARIDTELMPIMQRSVGVDLGVHHLATLSTGERIPNPKHYHARLRYLRISRAHARVRRARQYALHTLTSHLVREFDLICIEDLNVNAMVRGRHARAIQDAAFSEIRRQLTYKSDWYGRILVEVNRWYPSSKRCSVCQHTLEVLPLNQREWICPHCASCHDRDINAARNLLAEGLRQLAGRDDRDLRVDARGACPGESILVQVLAEEARSGQRNRACLGQMGLG